jgi:hypothetical protein
MIGRIAVIGLVVAASVATARAAVRYEYKEQSRSDFRALPSTELSGRVVIDGNRSRVDFISGSPYGLGSYMLTSGNGVTVIVQPFKKTYTEVHVTDARDALEANSGRIEITNDKIDLKKLDDHPIIAGLPTDHYHLETSYDMKMVLGSVTVSQIVKTTLDKWTTTSFGEILDTFAARSMSATGNTKLDALIDAEINNIKGIPLKQQMTLTTVGGESHVPGSKLNVNPRRQQHSEMVVISIENTEVPTSYFAIPLDYRKAELSENVDPSNIRILTMQEEPPQK